MAESCGGRSRCVESESEVPRSLPRGLRSREGGKADGPGPTGQWEEKQRGVKNACHAGPGCKWHQRTRDNDRVPEGQCQARGHAQAMQGEMGRKWGGWPNSGFCPFSVYLFVFFFQFPPIFTCQIQIWLWLVFKYPNNMQHTKITIRIYLCFTFICLYLIILIPNAIVSIMLTHIIHFRRILFLLYDQEVNNTLKLNIHYLLIFRIK